MIHDVLFHAWCYWEFQLLKSQIKKWRQKPTSNLNIATMTLPGRCMCCRLDTSVETWISLHLSHSGTMKRSEAEGKKSSRSLRRFTSRGSVQCHNVANVVLTIEGQLVKPPGIRRLASWQKLPKNISFWMAQFFSPRVSSVACFFCSNHPGLILCMKIWSVFFPLWFVKAFSGTAGPTERHWASDLRLRCLRRGWCGDDVATGFESGGSWRRKRDMLKMIYAQVMRRHLGGGNSNIVCFHFPNLGTMIQFHYFFSHGLWVETTT